jgi:hypothetical protein
MKTRKQRNPVARQLQTPRFAKRIVCSRKTYRRKERGANQASQDG